MVAMVGHVAASEPDLRQEVPDVHAITGVRIVTAPGESIESGTIVVRDGLIEAVGTDIEVPPDAVLTEFDPEESDLAVYPGLIDVYVPVEFAEAGDDEDEEGGEDDDKTLRPGQYPHPLITPGRSLTSQDWPEDRVGALRKAGFTTAVLAPESGLFRGLSALVNLGEGGYGANVIRPEQFAHVSLNARHSGREFPNSLMGAVALARQTFLDARWQAEARSIWQRNPAQPRPEFLEGIEPLEAVLKGERTVIFETEDMLGSLRAARLASEFDLDSSWLVGHGREYQRLESLAEPGLGQVLPLDFPDPPDVEEHQRDVSLAELRHWDLAPENAARVVGAGLDMVLTSHPHTSPAELFANIATVVERGLDPGTALAALTTEPAKLLGIDDMAGRLEPGYMANFVLVEGELFVESPKLREVWIDGRRHPLREIEPPEVEPAGTWALTLEVESMGDMDAELELRGKATNLSGSLDVMGNSVPLSEARVSGSRLDIRIDGSRLGMPGSITLYMDIEDDRGRGSGSSPQGEFGVRGRKTGDPDDEEETA